MEHHEGLIQHVQIIADRMLEDMAAQASEAFREILTSVPIRVLWDSPEHNRYGDFFGVPLDLGDGSNAPPADIILYAKPLLEHSHHDEAELHKMVKVTLMHEIGHYLGLNHEELAERGWN